jgi:hypothetical protein
MEILLRKVGIHQLAWMRVGKLEGRQIGTLPRIVAALRFGRASDVRRYYSQKRFSFKLSEATEAMLMKRTWQSRHL